MMKTALLTVARRRLVRPTLTVTTVRPITSTLKTWVQCWWVPESRGFDINHETINPESAQAVCKEPLAVAPTRTTEPLNGQQLEAVEAKKEPHVTVDSQSWWPPETRGFDIDHDNEAARTALLSKKQKISIPPPVVE